MVYAHAVQSLEREVANMQLTAALVNAMGGEAEAPSMATRQREFDEWLMSEPVQGDLAADEWRQVMGLGAA